jgi:hypothetical protein
MEGPLVHKSLFGKITVIFITTLAALISLAPLSAAGTSGKWEETYKEEPYVILRSERTVELRKDYTTLTTVQMVARVQKEEVKEIEAFTVTPEGETLKYQDIQELTPKKDYAVYSDERIKVITMPHVVVGSLIKWKATVESKKPVIPGNFYDLVYFSSTSPVKFQRYTLIAPKTVPLRFSYLNGERKPAVSHDGDTVVYVWEADDIGKIEREEYMPPWDEISEAVAVSTLPSWDELAKWAGDLFKKNLRLTEEMKETVARVTKGSKSTGDKIQAIIEYLQKDLRYVAMDIDFHGYEPHPTDRIFSNKYGDCKDYTLLAMAMLSEIGVKASPALFPAGRGFDPQKLLPIPTYFNHVILFFEVGGKRYYTDLLQKGYYFHEIPESLSGMKVLVLNESGGFFGSIPEADPSESASLEEERTVIDGKGDALVDMSIRFPRDLSITMREQLRNMADDTREKVFSAFESNASNGGKVREREWKSLDIAHKKITVRLKYENSHLIQRVGDMMIFGMPQRQRGDLFTSPTRKYPIVLQADSREEKKITYSIPEGYEIMHLPDDVVLKRDYASYERSYRAEGGTIVAKEIVCYKKSRTPASQYQEVRKFFDDVTSRTNDMIMIKKKG